MDKTSGEVSASEGRSRWRVSFDLEAIDGEEAGDDALLQAGAQHDSVILVIHVCEAWLSHGASELRLACQDIT